MNEIIRLPEDVMRRLDGMASRTGQSRDHILQRIVESGLQDEEADIEADAVEKRIEDGTESIHSSADVRRMLGLED